MNIRKNDIVSNTKPVTTYRWTPAAAGSRLRCVNTVVPVGTRFRVWKAKRDGSLYASNIDAKSYSVTTMLHVNDVIKLDAPKPSVKVGDIFVCSWGYDQTNVDYYKVLAVKNKSVVIAEVGQSRNYTGNMQGECVPNVNEIVGQPMTKRIQADCGDSVSLKITSFSWAFPWNGKTNHFTEWA